MSNTNTVRIPRCGKHTSGQAVVRLNGRDHYLGRYGTPAAKQAYERLIAEWLTAGRQLPETSAAITVTEVVAAYWQRCEKHYRKVDGTPTSEVELIRLAMKPLKAIYGDTPAASFGPKALKVVRQRMVETGWSRKVINTHVGRIKRCFKWAVENEMVPSSVFHGLLAVRGLQRGRTDARETSPVKPVAQVMVDAVLPHVSRQVQAMIKLQTLTACRPGEACIMRGCDLDMSGPIWVYRPATHKTQHHGHTREIFIGPKAQEVIKPFLRMNTTAYLFSPADAEAEHGAERRRHRKTPMTPSQAKRRPMRNREKVPGDCYTTSSYGKAVRAGCRKAFPLPEHLQRRPRDSNGQYRRLETVKAWKARLTPEEKAEIRVWRTAHEWHVNQLRHNAATNLRKEHGVELARIVLGHATAFTTEIYAEVDRQQAMQVIGKVG